MRKTFLIILLMLSLVVLTTGCTPVPEEPKGMVEIHLNEVVRSIFYAPQYVALTQGFFEEEGLTVTELTTAWGADKGAAALLSGSADIALFGPEAGVYVAREGVGEHFLAFAQLTAMDGSFLVSRKKYSDFQFTEVIGKEIIGGRPGGVPEMVLEHVLRKEGVEPFIDVDIIQNIDFAATAGAFQGGAGDFIAMFEPSATIMEDSGFGHIVASFGVEGGLIPYTAYHCTESYAQEHPEILQRFSDAIYKGILWVEEHSPEEIAVEVESYFPNVDLPILARSIERYKEQGTWPSTPILTNESLDYLQDIIIEAGELEEKISYDEIATDLYALKTIERLGKE